ncbi:hypothetical protein NYE25_01510 [Paenibacillus sp. FSL E2-8871]|uniref:hypothetical protein n=1 Tax=unclassified Paenibacillus TaxID=185978 RepID=UPI0030FC6E2C
MMDEGQVQVLELPEMKLIGLSITSSFIGHEPERVEAMKREQYVYALTIEVYQFANPTWPDEVDVYIPLR